MNIQDYLSILWRRKWVIVGSFIITVAAVVLVTARMKPTYSSSTMLRIATYTAGTVSSIDYTYANRLKNTYVILATTKPVLDELKQRLGLTDLPDISVSSVGDTELLQIKTEYSDPVLAAQIVNTLADILVSQSVELYTGSGQSSLEILEDQLKVMEDDLDQAREEYMNLVAKNPNDSAAIDTAKLSFEYQQDIYARMLDKYEQARISTAMREKSIYIVDPAVPPSSPSRPNMMRNIVLGMIVGLMGSAGLIFLLENFDTRMYSREQIKKATDLPLLAMVPNVDIRNMLNSANGNNHYVDAFRRLRSKLMALHQVSPHNILMVTSSEPGDGKSTLVRNLAYVLAQTGQKVVAIDCDMRRPSLQKIFKIQNEQGLSNVLNGETDIEDVLQDSPVPGVKVITSGPVPSNPVEILASQQMCHLIDQLRETYDHVLLDTPALSSVPDAIVLGPAVDGVILVVSQAKSHREAVQSASEQLEGVKAPILGVVINRVHQNHSYYYEDVKKDVSKIFKRAN